MVHNDYTHEVPPVVEIYSDRLTITSYGGLVPGLSLDEFFGGRSMPRNRELMRVYRDLDMVEQLGSGMNRILSVYHSDVFKVSDNFLEVCFPFDEEYLVSEESPGNIGGVERIRKEFGKISERIREECGSGSAQAFTIISQRPEITAEQLSEALGKTPRTAENYISKLKKAGFIARVGPKLGGHWEILDE